MGTFHEGKGDLHGITVVVDTPGAEIYVGRCDTETPDGIILLDADQHTDGADGKSKQDYLKAAANFGIWKKHDRIMIPRDHIASVTKLGEMTFD